MREGVGEGSVESEGEALAQRLPVCRALGVRERVGQAEAEAEAGALRESVGDCVGVSVAVGQREVEREAVCVGESLEEGVGRWVTLRLPVVQRDTVGVTVAQGGAVREGVAERHSEGVRTRVVDWEAVGQGEGVVLSVGSGHRLYTLPALPGEVAHLLPAAPPLATRREARVTPEAK